MLSFLALAALHQLPPPDRLRTILPNGAAILVENMPGQPLMSIQLFASAKYTPETNATHGYRHLLEHLAAKGQGGTLDHRLESQGAFLRAVTLRDVMQFEITLSPRQLRLGLSTISELLKPLKVTQKDIDREVSVIDQEIGLSNDASALASAAWSAAFGEQGLDPEGDIPTLMTATPEKLAGVQARQFAPSSLTLVIVGDVNVEQATHLAKEMLDLPADHFSQARTRGEGLPGRVECAGFGEARAAPCGAFGSVATAAEVAFAFAVASDLDGSFVTYTPSQERGLITVGRTDQSSGVGLYIDGLSSNDLPLMMERGKALARTWLLQQLSSPESNAYLRGMLICQRHAATPEEFLDSLDLVDDVAFEQAFTCFSKERAVISVGVR